MNLKAYSYSEKEQKEILKSIVILCDTREQKSDHITKWLDSKKIQWQDKKLNYGDYSFKVPCNSLLGINRDLFFDSEIVVERKNGLVELSGNISQDRERFEREWSRAGKCKKVLLVENGSYENILEGKYDTQLNSKSYFATLLAFSHRYNIDIQFVSTKWVAHYIYYLFYYFLRERL